jgi:hypothetical protein
MVIMDAKTWISSIEMNTLQLNKRLHARVDLIFSFQMVGEDEEDEYAEAWENDPLNLREMECSYG